MLFATNKAHNAHRRILAVTFTKKATAEMKQRIVRELSNLANNKNSHFAEALKTKHQLSDTQLQKQAQQILFELLQDYSHFAVSTIDSFFQQIIRAFSRELGLSAKYNLELDTKAIQQNAVDDFFLQLSPQNDKNTFQALLSIIQEKVEDNKAWNPKDDILALTSELFQEAVLQNQHNLFNFLSNTHNVTAYQDAQHAICQNYFKTYQEAVEQVRAYMHTHSLTEEMFTRFVFNPLHFDRNDIIEAIQKLPKTFCKFIENEDKTIALKAYPNAAAHEANLRQLCRPIYTLLTAQQHTLPLLTAHVILNKYSILTLLGQIANCIDRKNQELNRLPIAQTNQLLNNVVQANQHSPFIYEKIGTRIQHFLIDEFQDTSTMQWNAFRPLIHESLATNQANLLVGDVKQSIYRFRNSDYTLMLRGLKHDFPHTQANDLAGNWRSCENVVQANNAIFQQLATALNQEMNHNLNGAYPALENVIQEVYQNHTQKPMLTTQSTDKGFVQIHFSPCEANKEKEWKNNALSNLPQLVADIQQRGIPLGRVACLVRNNKEVQPIAQTLIRAGYNVMSNEGLRLTASPAVMFVLLSLKHALYPDDPIINFELQHFAQRLGITLTNHAPHTQSEGLFQQVQYIIHHYALMNDPAAAPYLIALQDKVHEYTNKYQSDLYNFLNWWDERAETFALSMQETTEAIQIVSIHKSKGLEYDVVIIPFCNWAKSTDRLSYNNILWVPTPETTLTTPDNKTNKQTKTTTPPLLPIQFSNKLSHTAFAQPYYEELLNLYLDNLNITYVAFTRAKKELYVFAPALEEGKAVTNIGTQLHAALQANPCGMRLMEEENVATYTLGEKAIYTTSNTPQVETPYIASPNHYQLTTNNYQLKLPSRNFFPHEDDTQTIGVLMHQILQQINQRGEEEKVLQEMLRAGILQTDLLPIIQEQLQTFWQLIATQQKQHWYDPTLFIILNEQDILLPDGKTRRPDRILIQKNPQNTHTGKQKNPQHAIIIDYKFGHTHPSHLEQVRDYTTLLQHMGYTTEGYLCYVQLGQIIPVK